MVADCFPRSDRSLLPFTRSRARFTPACRFFWRRVNDLKCLGEGGSDGAGDVGARLVALARDVPCGGIKLGVNPGCLDSVAAGVLRKVVRGGVVADVSTEVVQ